MSPKIKPLILCLLAAGLGAVSAAFATPPALTIDVDSQFAYAQHLFSQGQFEQAAIEYNRFYYFFPTDDRADTALFQEGLSYYRADRFQTANAIFTRLIAAGRKTAVTVRAYLLSGACRFKENDVSGAVAILHQLIRITDDPTVRDDAWYQLGWFMIETADWQQAAAALRELSPAGIERYSPDTLLSALAETDTIPQKNPTVAGLLSIAPGAGHLYCDRPGDALIAFLLNTALSLSAWQAFDRQMPWLGGLVSVVEMGVYSGTIYSAVGSAHKYNRDATHRFVDRLKRQAAPTLSLAPVPGGFHLCLNIDF